MQIVVKDSLEIFSQNFSHSIVVFRSENKIFLGFVQNAPNQKQSAFSVRNKYPF